MQIFLPMLCAFLKGTARQSAGLQFSRRHGKDAVLPLCFYLMIERLDGIVERTHPVDETAFHSLSAGDHSPHISRHFLGVHHHPFQRLPWDAAVGGDEPGDALLDLFKINGSCLLYTSDAAEKLEV